MNRFILKHSYLVTFVIMAILAWFFYRQFILVHSPLFPFLAIVAFIWALGSFLFIYYWPAITCNAYKRAILKYGLGGGPIPVNTIYAASNPSSPSAPGSTLMATGAEDLIYFGGWLDLSTGPLVLHVPDFSGRYYSLQLTNPADSVDFGYVGKRSSGTKAGDFLLTGPDWKGSVPEGMKQISSPGNFILAIGRALVDHDGNIEPVYALAKQIQITPFLDGQKT